MDISEVQQQFNKSYTQSKRFAWFTIAMFLILIAVFCLMVNRKPDDPYSKQIQDLRTAIAIQRATDSIIVQTLQKQDAEDSMRTQTLLSDIARTQTTLANITKRYDKNRNTVTNLSDTDQLRLLSDNITKGH